MIIFLGQIILVAQTCNFANPTMFLDDEDSDYDEFEPSKDTNSETNVSFQIEEYKFTRGHKGRLVTTHCCPRVLKVNPYESYLLN